MISFKKSYAEQLLQLALALSLLRVDPENYLEWGWESRLAGTGVGGWQLELRAAPLSEHPYANRKALSPLIEDLARFDRHTNPYDVQAYLLNVHSGESTTGSNTTTGTTQSQEPNINATISLSDPNRDTPDSAYINYETEDLFLNSDIFADTTSILDQNLADLSDYGEIPLTNYPLHNLPLKDEPPDIMQPPPIEIKRERASTSFTSDFGSMESPNGTYNGSQNYWEDYVEVKQEIKEELNVTSEAEDEDIKKPIETTNTVELTQEEMDLIEVLWKQDVDLGFTLTTPSTAPNQPVKSDNQDDLEKLKVLLEIKNDKVDDKKKKEEETLEDPWAGLSYTVDTETGEYVLNSTDGEAELPPPLADLFLEEALQLTDLVDEEIETSDEEKKNLEVEKIEEELKTSVDENYKPDVENLDETDEIEDLLCDMMIQTSTPHFQHPRQPTQNYGHGMNSLRQSGYHHHHHHHHHHQSRVPLSRAVSMEQRWQDLANLLSFPPGMGVGMGVGDMPPAHPHHPHYPSHYPYQAAGAIPQHGQFAHHPHPVLHNASLADIGPTQPHYGPNLGSAVSTSMHLTNSTSETDAGATGYKMDHDMMYYSNTSAELNHTTDGFLNSILNDEDLQLMDMAVNEGMYTMRMLDHNATSNNSSVLGGAAALNNTNNVGMIQSNLMQTSLNGSIVLNNGATHGAGDRLDASSDSAVSSMGSERVPSLSDGEWGDNGSDSAQEYHHSKYGGPFDYSYNSRLGDGSRQPPVAQKKHHMFAKRYFQEQNTTIPALPQPPHNATPASSLSQQNHLNADHLPASIKYEYDYMTPTTISHQNLEGAVGPLAITKQEEQTIPHHPLTAPDMKYPYSIDFARQTSRSSHHDIISHNHTYTLPHSSGANPKAQRDKKIRKAEEEHLTRDEKRARSLSIPIAVQDIINLPMDEFNERLSKYDLSENQLSLIRDIRRRGKNKVAAQNCRKRKLDQIITLADEVKDMKMRKERLLREREHVLSERKKVKDKFTALYRHVFQNLRDSDGNPYSSYQYSLQQSADGSVVLVPRTVENQHDVITNSTSHMNQQQSHPQHNHHSQQQPHNQHNNTNHHHNQHRPKE